MGSQKFVLQIFVIPNREIQKIIVLALTYSHPMDGLWSSFGEISVGNYHPIFNR
jgi:hypothetical protein